MLPWFGKFLLAVRHMNKMNKPVNLFLEKYTSNRSLIDMITQHFSNNSNLFALGYLYVYQEYFTLRVELDKLVKTNREGN